VSVGLDGQFASCAGSLIRVERKVVLIARDDAEIAETILRLARAGLATTIGFLDGGTDAWHDAGLSLASIVQMLVDTFCEVSARNRPRDERGPTSGCSRDVEKSLRCARAALATGGSSDRAHRFRVLGSGASTRRS
jgi:hypothetical protein